MVRAAVGLRERASFIRSPAQPALPRLGPLLSPTSAPRRAPFAGRINALVPVAPWHDASPLADPFGLTTLDVLRGLARARVSDASRQRAWTSMHASTKFAARCRPAGRTRRR